MRQLSKRTYQCDVSSGGMFACAGIRSGGLPLGGARIVERIALSDEWLSWDPERLHTYPGAHAEPALTPIGERRHDGVGFANREDAAPGGQRAGVLEVGYFLGLGVVVGLAVSFALMASVYLVG